MVLCECGRGSFDSTKYSQCYECQFADFKECECGHGIFDPTRFSECFTCAGVG